MQPPTLDQHRQRHGVHGDDQYVPESDITSDSNDEFASASEGDDDSAWDPVVIRSPVISRQSPQSPQQEFPTKNYPPIQQQPSGSSSLLSQQQHQSFSVELEGFETGHEEQQQQEHQHVEQSSWENRFQGHQQQTHQHQTHSFQYSATQLTEEHSFTSFGYEEHSSNATAMSEYQQNQQASFDEFQSYQPQYGSPALQQTAQISPGQTIARGNTPKLRERMRPSSKHFSKVVQAYLDPDSSALHRTPVSESARQAWLREHEDQQQQSSEDEVEENTEALHQQRIETFMEQFQATTPTSVSQSNNVDRLSESAFQSYNTRSITDTRSSRTTHITATRSTSLHHSASYGARQSFTQESNVAFDGDASDTAEMESGWGFDDAGLEELSATIQPTSTIRSTEHLSGGMHRALQSTYQSSTQQFSHEQRIQQTQALPPITSTQTTSYSAVSIQNMEPSLADNVEDSWGFDDDIGISEPMEVDLPEPTQRASMDTPMHISTKPPSSLVHHSHADEEETWDYGDEKLEFDTPIVTEQSTKSITTVASVTIQQSQDNFSHIHNVQEVPGDADDAWGYDEELDIQLEDPGTSLQEPEPTTDDHVLPVVEGPPSSTRSVSFVAQDVEDAEDSWGFSMDEVVQPELIVEQPQAHELLEDLIPTETTHEHIQVETTKLAPVPLSETMVVRESSIILESRQSHDSSMQDIIEEAQTTLNVCPSPTAERIVARDHTNTETIIGGMEVEDLDANTEDAWGFDDETEPQINNDESPASAHTEMEITTQSSSIEINYSSQDVKADESDMKGEDKQPEIAEELPHVCTESDHEQDVEVQEVMRTAFESSLQTTSVSTTSVVAIESSVVSVSEHRIENSNTQEVSRDIPEQLSSSASRSITEQVSHSQTIQISPVTSTLQQVEPIEIDINASLEDNVALETSQDSESGSDIYGDLSTARSFNASCNRLSEILDDDDYLEHMERGVPMNRSISTPISDEESSPKYIVEDDIAEMMEQGMTRPFDGAYSSVSLLEDDQTGSLDDPFSLDMEATESRAAAIPTHERDVSSGLDLVVAASEQVSQTTELAGVSTHEMSASEKVISVKLEEEEKTSMEYEYTRELDTQSVLETHGQPSLVQTTDSIQVTDSVASKDIIIDDNVTATTETAINILETVAGAGVCASVETHAESIVETSPQVSFKTDAEDDLETSTKVDIETSTEVSVETSTEVNFEASTETNAEFAEITIETTNVSAETTEVSAETTEVSAETTEVSVESTEVSVESTEVSVESTEVSVETTDVNVDTAKVSIDFRTGVSAETSTEASAEIDTKFATEAGVEASAETVACIDAPPEPVSGAELADLESHIAIETFAEEQDPDKDPMNPFSDAAAYEDQDSWPASEVPELGKTLSEEEHIPSLSPERTLPLEVQHQVYDHTDAKETISAFSGLAEPEVEEDAWMDQDMNITIETGHQDFLSAAIEPSHDVPSNKSPSEHETAMETVSLDHASAGELASTPIEQLNQPEPTIQPSLAEMSGGIAADSWDWDDKEAEIEIEAEYGVQETLSQDHQLEVTLSQQSSVQTEQVSIKQDDEHQSTTANVEEVASKPSLSVFEVSSDQVETTVCVADQSSSSVQVKSSIEVEHAQGQTFSVRTSESLETTTTTETSFVTHQVIKSELYESLQTQTSAFNEVVTPIGSGLTVDDNIVQAVENLDDMVAWDNDDSWPDVIQQKQVSALETSAEQNVQSLKYEQSDETAASREANSFLDELDSILNTDKSITDNQPVEDNKPMSSVSASASESLLAHVDDLMDTQEPEADPWGDTIPEMEISLMATQDVVPEATTVEEPAASFTHTILEQATSTSELASDIKTMENHPEPSSDADRSTQIELTEDDADAWGQDMDIVIDNIVHATHEQTLVQMENTFEKATPTVESETVTSLVTIENDPVLLGSKQSPVKNVDHDSTVATRAPFTQPLDSIVFEDDAWDTEDPVIQDDLHHSLIENPVAPKELVSASVTEEPSLPVDTKDTSDIQEKSTLIKEEIDISALDNAWDFDDEEDSSMAIESTFKSTLMTSSSYSVSSAEKSFSPGSRLKSAQVPPVPHLTGLKDHTQSEARRESIHGDSAMRTDSSEGEGSSSNLSPWQDISPASVSKRSEAMLSIGSGIESVCSVRSLDEEFKTSSSSLESRPSHGELFDHGSGSGSGSRPGSMESKKGLEVSASMSWTTDLKEEDEWDNDLDTHSILPTLQKVDEPFSGTIVSKVEVQSSMEGSSRVVTEEKSLTIEEQSLELDLPEIGEADSWNFDLDTSVSDQASAISGGAFAASLLTKDRAASSFESISSQPVPQTLSAASSEKIVTPDSLGPKSDAPTEEFEDDSHLPLAIRQQRARLRAKGKPLPPISKYKSTKGKKLSSLSPSASSTDSFSAQEMQPESASSPLLSPAKVPVSPLLQSKPATTDQKFISPALQKQRERLELKRAAAAAAAATSLSGTRRLTVTDSTVDMAAKPPSGLASMSLSSSSSSPSLKHTLGSPKLGKRTILVSESKELHSGGLSSRLKDPSSEPLSPSILSGEDDRFHGFARRGSGASSETGHASIVNRSRSSSNVSVPASPSLTSSRVPVGGQSPLLRFTQVPSPTDGFVSRRSKDFGGSGISNRSRAAVERHQDSEVVRTSQSEVLRHGTRTSISSMTESGWDQTIEDFEDQEAIATTTTTTNEKSSMLSGVMSLKSTKSEKSPEIRPSLFSSTSSSSFYNQSVPGMDDDHDDRFGDSKAPKLTGVAMSKKSDDAEEYDPYGPMASRYKSSDKGTLSFSSSSVTDASESMIENMKRGSPSMSIKSPTMGTQISNRHDHGSKSGHTGAGMMSGLGGSNSLLGDIASIAAEKKSSQATAAVIGGGSFETGRSMTSSSSPPSSSKSPRSPLSSSSSTIQKSGSWSFGSWVSSAVAAATETIDKAYETLDPEYSRIKKGSGTGDGSGGASGSMSPELGGDPDSLSPFKKPGYVVGGSSLALGLASISTAGSSSTTTMAKTSTTTVTETSQGFGSEESMSSFGIMGRTSSSSNVSGDHVSGSSSYAMAGSSSDTYSQHRGSHEYQSSHRSFGHQESPLSPRLTRKNAAKDR